MKVSTIKTILIILAIIAVGLGIWKGLSAARGAMQEVEQVYTDGVETYDNTLTLPKEANR